MYIYFWLLFVSFTARSKQKSEAKPQVAITRNGKGGLLFDLAELLPVVDEKPTTTGGSALFVQEMLAHQLLLIGTWGTVGREEGVVG